MLPNFFVIGAMKAGTTALWSYLGQHPSVYVATKEPNFFAFAWDRGQDWYESLFEGASGEPARGDISPSYTQYPKGVPARIASLVPDARLIYSLRHPIERIQAHYLHAVVGGKEHRPIELALDETPWYVTCSKYSTWIKHYL